MPTNFTDLQLDALRELANIGSGTAGTSLSSMLGREVGLSVPSALVMNLADAVEAAGDVEAAATAAVIPISGELSGVVVLLFGSGDVDTLCALLGVEPGTEIGMSAIGEIGNILGTSYLNAIVLMTGMELEPQPPLTASDMLGALMQSVLAETVDPAQSAVLLLESDLSVEGEECSMSFLLIPAAGGIETVLARMGAA